MSLFKKERFSIRKICGIVGSVLLGSVLVAPSVIHASTYHYVEKSALTKEEQSKIQAGIPTDNEASYALIYQQEALPATGSSTSVLTALGLLAVGSLVLLVHKRKKVSSLFLVTTIGLISLSSMQALDISNPLKAPSNEGVVQIAGYRYIGYLSLDDDAISEIQHKDEGTKNVPVSETQVSIPNEAPKAEKPKYTEPVSTVPDEAPKVEKPDYTQPIGTNLVEPEVQPALPEAVVTEKGEPAVQPALPEYTSKVAPTLTLDKVTEDAMDRSAKLDYTLENTGNAEIKSIIAEIKDGDTVVKRVDLSKEKLTDAIQGLDLFKDYKIATTMTYNRGEGDETSKLDEKPLRLELKKS